MEEVPDWLNELRSIEDEPIEEETSEIEELPPMRTEVEPATLSEEVNKLDWLEELGPPKVVPSKGGWVSEAGAPEQPIKAEASAVAEAPKPARKAAGLKVEQDAPNRLELARQALNFGKLGEAADHYGYLLRRRLLIKDVIADLDAAVHRYPGDATLWQILGDAYMRNNQLRPALDAYTRAKDLL
jgi:tetratricopeptide (TPR) repeat protein